MKEKLGNSTNSHSWLQNVIFVGKTAGAFGLLIMYLLIPKPFLASQFATLSLTRGLPGQSPSKVEKEEQSSRLEDSRQESTISTAIGDVPRRRWPYQCLINCVLNLTSKGLCLTPLLFASLQTVLNVLHHMRNLLKHFCYLTLTLKYCFL